MGRKGAGGGSSFVAFSVQQACGVWAMHEWMFMCGKHACLLGFLQDVAVAVAVVVSCLLVHLPVVA